MGNDAYHLLVAFHGGDPENEGIEGIILFLHQRERRCYAAVVASLDITPRLARIQYGYYLTQTTTLSGPSMLRSRRQQKQ